MTSEILAEWGLLIAALCGLTLAVLSQRLAVRDLWALDKNGVNGAAVIAARAGVMTARLSTIQFLASVGVAVWLLLREPSLQDCRIVIALLIGAIVLGALRLAVVYRARQDAAQVERAAKRGR